MTNRTERSRLIVAGLALASVLGLAVASLPGGDGEVPAAAPLPTPLTGPRGPSPISEEHVEIAPARPIRGYPGRLEAAPGDHFRYRLDAHWRADLEPNTKELSWGIGEGLPARVETRLRGALEVSVLAQEDRAYVLRVRVRAAEASANAGLVKRRFSIDELAQPMLVRLSEEGRVLGYAFEESVSPATQSLLIGTFSLSHQFVLRDQRGQWSASALRDEVGRFDATFAWRPDVFKARLRLDRSMLSYAAGANQEIAESDGHAWIEDGWITGVETQEERRGHLENLISTSTSIRLGMKLVERSTIAVHDLGRDPGRTWQTAPAEARTLDSHDPESAARTADVQDPKAAITAALGGLTDVVETGRLYTFAGYEAWRRIADLVGAFPDVVLPQLNETLRSGTLDNATENWISSALAKAGAAGSRAATAALGDLIGDVSLPENLRLSALVAAHQLQRGVPVELIEGATDILLADLGEGSPLPTAASLLLGSFAGARGLPPAAATLLEASLDLVREVSFANDQPSVYFAALRNSGRADLVSRGLDYVEDPDAAVRRAALDALGGLPDDPRAREALWRAAEHDASSGVRAMALDTLAEVSPEEGADRRLLAIVESAPGAEVRTRAVDALGTHAMRGSKAAYATLVELASRPGDWTRQARTILADVDASDARSEDLVDRETASDA